MNKKRIVIAIDGPAGAGKSTLAKRVAEKLGFVYVNSGALYRAVALWALRLGVDLSDTYRVAQLAKEAQIELRPTNGRVFLNGEDLSDPCRPSRFAERAAYGSARTQHRYGRPGHRLGGFPGGPGKNLSRR